MDGRDNEREVGVGRRGRGQWSDSEVERRRTKERKEGRRYSGSLMKRGGRRTLGRALKKR